MRSGCGEREPRRDSTLPPAAAAHDDPAMLPLRLDCSRCATAHDPQVLQTVCAACGKPLLARYDLDAAAGAMRPNGMAGRRTDLWRYREVLPVATEGEI